MFTAFKKLKPSEIPACYTFKKFSADLGILHGINDVDYRFCEQMDYFKTKYEWTKYRKMGKVIVCLSKVTIFGKPSVPC